MNRGFMKEYYDLKYRDTFMVTAMEIDEHCGELQRRVMEMEGRKKLWTGEVQNVVLIHILSSRAADAAW